MMPWLWFIFGLGFGHRGTHDYDEPCINLFADDTNKVGPSYPCPRNVESVFRLQKLWIARVKWLQYYIIVTGENLDDLKLHLRGTRIPWRCCTTTYGWVFDTIVLCFWLSFCFSSSWECLSTNFHHQWPTIWSVDSHRFKRSYTLKCEQSFRV